MSNWNAYQKLALEEYSHGDFAHCTTTREVGDALLRFILTELATSEDCEDIYTAIQRMETAERDIADVRITLENRGPQRP